MACNKRELKNFIRKKANASIMEGDCKAIKVNKNINLWFIDEILPILFSILYKNKQNLSLFENYLNCVFAGRKFIRIWNIAKSIYLKFGK